MLSEREGADLPAARWRRRQCPGHDSGHQRNLHTAVNYSRRFVSARETESEKEMVSEGDRRMLNTCVSSADAKSAACYLPLWPTLLLLNLSPKVYKAATTCSPCLHSSQTSPGRVSARLWEGGLRGRRLRLVSHKLPQNNPNYQQNSDKYKCRTCC